MVVAGEMSGDRHAAKLVDALQIERPDLSFFGSAGLLMRESGVEAIIEADELSVIGLPEIAAALPMFIRAFRALVHAAEVRKPDCVILVDFPDFNLKLAKALKKRGFKVVYYISPQLWAWRKYRVRTIKKHVDLLLSILPFEKDWYAKQGIEHIEYVGSPLAREVHASMSREEFRSQHSFSNDTKLVALLPGSRRKEVTKILPAMLESVRMMLNADATLEFCLALADERLAESVDEAIELAFENQPELKKKLNVVSGETYNILNASDAAAVASGTATLETGIIGTPMAIVYKATALNYKLLRPLIDVEHFGLINLIAEERVAKEFIQDDFTPPTLADELFRLLEPETNKKVREDLGTATDKLGHGGASKRAAEAVLKLIAQTSFFFIAFTSSLSLCRLFT